MFSFAKDYVHISKSKPKCSQSLDFLQFCYTQSGQPTSVIGVGEVGNFHIFDDIFLVKNFKDISNMHADL